MTELSAVNKDISNQSLQKYIYENIPIASSLGVEVKHVSKNKITLLAPLSANINHKKTAFGGSLHALTTLACWSLLYVNLKELCAIPENIIAKSNIEFLKPMTGNFEAECHIPDEVDWIKFLKTFHRMKKARVCMSAYIMQDNIIAVDYKGVFVAFQ